MTDAAQDLLRAFEALPKADQHDVLVHLLRLPIEAEWVAPSDEELIHAARAVFLEFDSSWAPWESGMTHTMNYKGYVASMVFDAEDKIIVGRVLDIDDIVSFHGNSVAEFEANFHAAVDDYLETEKDLEAAAPRTRASTPSAPGDE